MKRKYKIIFLTALLCATAGVSIHSLWSDNNNSRTYLPSKEYYHTEIENVI